MLISGLTVIVAMAGMFISGDKTFVAFAVGTILVVAIAVCASLTVLPAMLAWLGDRVDKGRVPFLSRRRATGASPASGPRSSTGVMRRPVVALVLAGGALIALSIPALSLKTVVTGVDDLPQDLAVIKTYNQIRKVFPTQGVTATVVVKADNVRSGEAAAGIENLRRQLQASIYPPGPDVTYSKDGTVAKIDVATPGTGNDAPVRNAMNEIRNEIIPATMGGIGGTSVNVTGDAAGSADFRDQLNSRLPLIFAFVFGLTFIIFLVTFRSIVIPIKAILLNLLSVGAAYGVLVLVFQDGHGESLLNFSSNGGVTSGCRCSCS